MHNLMDAKCRWRSDRLDGSGSFRETLGQTKVMQIRQGETLKHQGAITMKFVVQQLNLLGFGSVCNCP